MIDWTKLLREGPTDWLLEESNPSVRYFTLREIFDRSENDPQVVAAKQAIAKWQIAERIFRKQRLRGYWEKKEDPYIPKYKVSYWQIIMLGQLGVDMTDIRVENACNHIFEFQTVDGAFTSQTEESLTREYEWRLRKGRKLAPKEKWLSQIIFEQQLSCLTGNMAAALIRLGYEGDPRTRKALKWLVKIQNGDGGWKCPYWSAHVKDRHSCFHGTICTLEALSMTRDEHRSPEMGASIEKGAEFILMHRLFKADHRGYEVINPSWLRLSFPMFWGYSILRGLDVLTKLGYVNDDRLNDAVEILMQKRQKDGTWVLESTPSGRMQADVEAKGKPSKWVTLIALRTLKRLSSAGIN